MPEPRRLGWRTSPGGFALAGAPPALWAALFLLAPLAVVWAYSFGETAGLTRVVATGTAANYARALEPLYLAVILKSAALAALTTLICLIAGVPVALAIAFAPARARGWLLLAVILPFWTNLLVRTYALMTILRREGLVNDVLGGLWEVLRRLGADVGAFVPLPLLHNSFALVLGLVYVNLPFLILPVYAALDRLDRSLIEASLDLGAGHLRTLRDVVLPLAAPGLAAGALLTFVPALGSFLTPDLLGGPDGQMIASVIERQFKRANDWPFGAALSFLLVYLTIAVLFVQARLDRGRG